jgi:hypothetical protein
MEGEWQAEKREQPENGKAERRMKKRGGRTQSLQNEPITTTRQNTDMTIRAKMCI